MITQAVILAGGLGQRLGELTRATPKPLLEVGGKPFLLYLFNELRRQGVTRILVLAGRYGEQVEALCQDLDDVRVVVEETPLGTGGALRDAAPHLADAFYFLNGDSLFDINILALGARLFTSDATLGVLSLRSVADGSRFGAVEISGETITAFLPRPLRPGPSLINGGVAALRKAVVDAMPEDGAVSMEAEVYPKLVALEALKGQVFDRPFIDIGVPDDFARAQQAVPAMLHRGAVIFDRDGVLNEDVGYAHRPEQIVWVAGARDAIRAVNEAGLLAMVATNQAGVAHGYYSEADVRALHTWMNQDLAKSGAHIDAFEYSPFHIDGVVEAYRRDSPCRKPGPQMIEKLLARYSVDASRVLMVGDGETDLEAARAAKISGHLFSGGDLHAFLAPLLPRLVKPL